MARENYSLASFNRGMISRLGLARVDVKRVALGAEIQENWIPRVLGSMSIRPGFQYIGATNGNAATRMIPFIFGSADCAKLELTASVLRVWIQDTVLTRPSVSTAVTNGTFTTDVASWTDNDEASTTSSWVAPGYLQLVGNGTARAIRDQQVTVAAADQSVEHALRVEIARGPVYVRVGSTSGGQEYVGETALGTGKHSLAFTPTGNFYIRFFSSLARVVWVDSCTVEASGAVSIATPWTADELQDVRYEQVADVVYVASGLQPYKIERRGTRPDARSWSVVKYQPEDGPFKIQNVSPTTLSATALTGNVTITSSQPLFKTEHTGSLLSITSVGQTVTTTSAVTGGVTSSIRVTGINESRTFSYIISGNASVSTVDLQRSYDNATWANVGGIFSWTADASGAVADGFDNQVVYYRLRLSNRVAPDSITMTLTIGSGSVRGVGRITFFNTSQSVDLEVLSDLGGTSASETWQMGSWSDVDGWPTAVRMQEGRLWWAGVGSVWGTISDTVESFDEDDTGDAGPINRTIGAGPADTVNWIIAVQRIILGTDAAEHSVRSSSFDEPITALNFHLKAASTHGSAAVDATQIDQSAYFVHRNSSRVYEMTFDVRGYDYTSNDATRLIPDAASSGIVRMAVQRQPDTRLHCVLGDGTVLLLVVDKVEEVQCWVTVVTDGDIEDVCVLPAEAGDIDDRVYYVIKRTINGSTVRYIERWAQEADCLGAAQCKLADSFVAYSGTPTLTVTAAHLAGEEVVIWADSADIGTNDTTDPASWTQRYTLNGSGQATLSAYVTDYVVGLPYQARFKSVKLGLATSEIPAPLNRDKRISHLGIVAADIHKQGLRYGPDFDHLDSMPGVESGTAVTSEVRTDYDEDPVSFNGTWTTDSRLCLVAQAPRPCTVLAATIDLKVT